MPNTARLATVAIAVAAVALGAYLSGGADGKPASIAPHTQRALLRVAQRTGYTQGDDRRPYDVTVIRTTYRGAMAIIGGSSSPSPPAREPVYLLAARGRFNMLIGFMPRGQAIRRASPRYTDHVLEVLVSARSLQMIESGLLDKYPKLSNAVDLR
jgi:hypothetical protein